MEHQNTPINMAKNQVSSWSRSDFIFIAVVGVLIFLLRMYIANPFIVSGESMDPTFHDGQYIIVDQISYNHGACMDQTFSLQYNRFFTR